ncbi:MFB-1 protein, partial [Aphelenchoides avenae]
MPFIGKDWRAPGETWVRLCHTSGWERIKLRPIQIASCADSGCNLTVEDHFKRSRTVSSCSLSSTDDTMSSSTGVMRSDSDDSVYDDDEPLPQPHCFVKSKSKEFIGCTSMSEAFHRLDLARAVRDVRRFNYVCK